MGKRGPKPTPVVERIFAHVEIGEPQVATVVGKCQLYTRSKTKGRCIYGTITANPDDGFLGRTVLVHRVVFHKLVRPLESGEHVDHLCLNTLCVNPQHLEAVSQAENNRRTRERGNHVSGFSFYKRPAKAAA